MIATSLPSAISLKSAVSDIVRGGKLQGKGEDRSPFFFLVGAGVSAGPIKLAREVAAECRDRVNGNSDSPGPPDSDPQEMYSYWVERAFPQPRQQQDYFRQMMEGKPISAATLRLAHILTDSRTPKIIVTPNFDDALSRAVRLFGREPVICDHPATTSRINLNSDDIRIIHVHGTYWFYDLVNLKEQISERSADSELTTLTMANLLTSLLRDRSPIVVGYSGWERDVIMTCLKRRLVGQLLLNHLYWFCYSLEDAERLPRWLKDHPNVRIVLPDSVLDQIKQNQPEISSDPANSDPLSGRETDRDGKKLKAETVFEEMIRAWDVGRPLLMKDPLGHFIEQLEQVIPRQEESRGSAAPNPYDFTGLLAGLRSLTKGAAKESADVLGQLRKFAETADYEGVIQHASKSDLSGKSDMQRWEIMKILMDAGRRIRDPRIRLDAYTLATDIGNQIYPKQVGNNDLAGQLADATLVKASLLGVLDRSQEELETYDELLSLFEGSQLRSAKVWVAKGKYNKARRLGLLARYDEEDQLYAEVVDQFEHCDISAVREVVAVALRRKAFRQYLRGKEAEAEAAFNKLLTMIIESPDSETVSRELAWALSDKGSYLASKGQYKASLQCYDEILNRFEKSELSSLQEPVAKAMGNRGNRLQALQDFDSAREAYKALIDRFASSQNLEIQAAVQKAREVLARL
jgi:tetratricopeptide (TPR) repeat protein